MFQHVTSYHRSVLIVATIGLSVFGSRAADDPRDWSEWCLVAGSAMALALADVLSDLDAKLRLLEQSSRVPRDEVWRDLADTPTLRKLRWLAGIAAVFVALAICLQVVPEIDWPQVSISN